MQLSLFKTVQNMRLTYSKLSKIQFNLFKTSQICSLFKTVQNAVQSVQNCPKCSPVDSKLSSMQLPRFKTIEYAVSSTQMYPVTSWVTLKQQ